MLSLHSARLKESKTLIYSAEVLHLAQQAGGILANEAQQTRKSTCQSLHQRKLDTIQEFACLSTRTTRERALQTLSQSSEIHRPRNDRTKSGAD